jgi:hypothetical protein
LLLYLVMHSRERLVKDRFRQRRNAVVDIYRHWNVSSVREVSIKKKATVSGVITNNFLEFCHCQQTGIDDLAITPKSSFYRYVY